MTDLHHTIAHHIVRRLVDAYSFSGQLKCSFDPSMPLNISDLTQPFLMTCKSPPSGGTPGWVVALIIIGSMLGPFVLGALVYAVYALIKCCRKAWRKCRDARYRRARLAAEEAARLEAEKAARKEYDVASDTSDSLPTPTSDYH